MCSPCSPRPTSKVLSPRSISSPQYHHVPRERSRENIRRKRKMVDALAAVDISGSLGAVGYGLAAIGPGIGVGIVFAAYIQASARQPESAAAHRTWLIMGIAVVDALALLGLVVAVTLLATRHATGVIHELRPPEGAPDHPAHPR